VRSPRWWISQGTRHTPDLVAQPHTITRDAFLRRPPPPDVRHDREHCAVLVQADRLHGRPCPGQESQNHSTAVPRHVLRLHAESVLSPEPRLLDVNDPGPRAEPLRPAPAGAFKRRTGVSARPRARPRSYASSTSFVRGSSISSSLFSNTVRRPGTISSRAPAGWTLPASVEHRVDT
jgi:hypothetical protein